MLNKKAKIDLLPLVIILLIIVLTIWFVVMLTR